MYGRGAFDVGYLLGTAMDVPTRRALEQELVRHYHDCLVLGGVQDYGFEECFTDYLAFVQFTAVLYALPGVYDRGSVTDANRATAMKVRDALYRNLQPEIDLLQDLKENSESE